MLIILGITPVAAPFPAMTLKNAITKVGSVNLVFKAFFTVSILHSVGRHYLITHNIGIDKRVDVDSSAIAMGRNGVCVSHHPIIECR